MIENTNSLREIKEFLSSKSENGDDIMKLVSRKFTKILNTREEIVNTCAEILYFHNWNPKINLEDTKLLLEGQVYKTCSKCSGMGRVYLWE